MSKLKLDNKAIAESFFDYTLMMGIVAPIKDYKLVWLFNKEMGLNFKINNDLEIKLSRKGRDYYFRVYDYPVKLEYITHYLYNNQYDGEYLLPEFKHLDFLWLVKGEEMEVTDYLALLPAVKKIPGVQLVTEMVSEKIKNKQHLIF
jgi:hypothetical protein